MKLKVNLISSLKDEVHSRGFKENGYSYLRSETIHGGDSKPTIGGLQCSREVTYLSLSCFLIMKASISSTCMQSANPLNRKKILTPFHPPLPFFLPVEIHN